MIDTDGLAWFKSSHSGNEPGSACVEVAWFKSSYSGNEPGSDCVEVAAAPEAVLVRDSKNAQGPRLALSPSGWSAFVAFAAAAAESR